MSAEQKPSELPVANADEVLHQWKKFLRSTAHRDEIWDRLVADHPGKWAGIAGDFLVVRSDPEEVLSELEAVSALDYAIVEYINPDPDAVIIAS